ncbi:unnamed protein product [Effrenium voratum]|nr:unnamed protein product [Effrenium voratum]
MAGVAGAQAACIKEGVAYQDKMLPSPHAWVADWKACQSECKQLPHCSIFTFKADTWPKGGCWLMPALKYTQAVNDTQAVSGPQDCEAAVQPIPLPADLLKPLGPDSVPTLPPSVPMAQADPKTNLRKAGTTPEGESNCLEKGVAFADSFLPSPHLYVESPEICQERCQEQPHCSVFTYKSDTSPSGGCWLLPARNAKTVSDDKATSGYKDCQVPSSVESIVQVKAETCLEKGVALKDPFLPLPSLNTETAEQCQQRCKDQPTCNIFTFKSDGECWLMPAFKYAKRVKDEKAISGPGDCDVPPTVMETCLSDGLVYKDPLLPSAHLYFLHWQDCQQACQQHDSCNAFTFKEDSSPAGACWLFPDISYTTQAKDAFAVSGPKKCPGVPYKVEYVQPDPSALSVVSPACLAQGVGFLDKMMTTPQVFVPNWEACQVACAKHATCELFTFRNSTTPPGGCFLFSRAKFATKYHEKTAVSGRKYCGKSSDAKLAAAQLQASLDANQVGLPSSGALDAGTTGTTGTAAVDTAGMTGAAGTAMSGTAAGAAGTAGTGTAGTAGAVGTAMSGTAAGTAGMTGAAGTAMSGTAAGTAGTVGTGTAGMTGAAGTAMSGTAAGTAGTAGTGTAGMTGAAGTAMSGMAAGTAGTVGTGTAGMTGAAGTAMSGTAAGTAGTAGTGTAGMTGAAGTAMSGTAAGTAGTAAAVGTTGTAGTAGAAGTTGTAAVNSMSEILANNNGASPAEAAAAAASGVAAAATSDAAEVGGPVTLLPKARGVAKAGRTLHLFAGGKPKSWIFMKWTCILLSGSTL